MKLDYSWKALCEPGDAVDYFNPASSRPLTAGINKFSLSNAWWLAEISRLIYHPDFHKKEEIDLSCFEYDMIGLIDNKKTSTQVALLKVNYDRPCLVIAFRGTDDIENWVTNVHVYQEPFDGPGQVHSGFKDAYLSIREELHELLVNNVLPIFITGHSLGAALATLTTAEIYKNKHFDSCYTFGSPKTGNPTFINAIKSKQIYRLINNCDVVTTVPINFVGIQYEHIGASYLLSDSGELVEGMSENEIYAYQKDQLQGLKQYAKSKFFGNKLKSVTEDLPPFLADHAPLNYVIKLQRLLTK